MKSRIAASILAAGLLIGLTGCGMVTPIATQIEYNAGDGVSATLGDVALRNVFVVTNQTASKANNGSLVLTAFNNGVTDQRVNVQYTSNGVKTNLYIDVPARSSIALGVDGVAPIPLTGIDSPAGSMMTITFQAGSAETQNVLVPVLDTTLEMYQDLGPSGTAS